MTGNFPRNIRTVKLPIQYCSLSAHEQPEIPLLRTSLHSRAGVPFARIVCPVRLLNLKYEKLKGLGHVVSMPAARLGPRTVQFKR